MFDMGITALDNFIEELQDRDFTSIIKIFIRKGGQIAAVYQWECTGWGNALIWKNLQSLLHSSTELTHNCYAKLFLSYRKKEEERTSRAIQSCLYLFPSAKQNKRHHSASWYGPCPSFQPHFSPHPFCPFNPSYIKSLPFLQWMVLFCNT